MQDYLILRKAGDKLGDDNFCTINALATATGYSFSRCKRKLEKHGRKFRRGTTQFVQERALKAFGYQMKHAYKSSTEVRYRKRRTNSCVYEEQILVSVGLNANQFAKKYNKGTYFVGFHGSIDHVACLVDGVYNDWIDKKYRGKAPQFIVDSAFLITKKEQ